MVIKKSKIFSRGKCESDSCAYILGFIGAAFYYISAATGFWMGVLGLIKAMIWPVFLVYGLLSFLGL
jgi:hypothetical protein